MKHHFNPSEHALTEKLLDLVARLESHYQLQITGFLDPRQQDIAQCLFRKAGIRYFSSNDSYPLEQARFILAPDYYEFSREDFKMALVEVCYQGKFSQLSHSQILGFLLNGLGLRRQVIGDILVADGYAQIVLEQKIADYVVSNTHRVAQTGVRLNTIDFEQLNVVTPVTEQELVLSSSLRLDKLVALFTKQSRRQAHLLIETGGVKVNHREVLKGHLDVDLGDLISIRGYGRFFVKDNLGKSKMEKYKLMVEKTIGR